MNSQPLTGLMPLEPPPPPPPDPWQAIGLVLLAVCIALALLWWWRRPSRQRLRRLGWLERALVRPGSDPADIATRLDALLREALGQGRLSAEHPTAAVAAADWQSLVDTLEQARFSPRAMDSERLAGLFPLARQILRHRHGDA